MSLMLVNGYANKKLTENVCCAIVLIWKIEPLCKYDYKGTINCQEKSYKKKQKKDFYE